MAFTHNNHLNSTFLTNDGRRSDYIPHGTYMVKIGKCQSLPQTPLVEAIRAARLIRESTKQEIWLCLSGGVDSDCMAQAFLAAGIPFRAAIMKFAGNLNWFDIKYAVEFCEKRRVPYEIFNLDLLEFYQSGTYLRYARDYRCRSVQLATHLYLLKKIPGFPVLSWNVPLIELTDEMKTALYLPKDTYFSYHRLFVRDARDGVGFFFLYTPELFFSFFRLPLYRDILLQRGSGAGQALDYRNKCQVYRDGGFEVFDRPDKFDGFEVAKIYFQNYFGEDKAFEHRYRDPLWNKYPCESKDLFRIPRCFLEFPEYTNVTGTTPSPLELDRAMTLQALKGSENFTSVV